MRSKLGRFAFVVAMLVGAPAVVGAQGLAGLAVRGGYTVNPDQFSAGARYALPLARTSWWLEPNGDVGFGDGATLMALSTDVVYRHRVGPRSPWTLYGGGGPAINFYRVAGDMNAFAGATAHAGLAHTSGFFGQLSVGAFDSPRMRLWAGYAFQPKAPARAPRPPARRR